MTDSGLFQNTLGARVSRGEEDAPRTIVPPMTNGGKLRAMNNDELATWLAQEFGNTKRRGAWSEKEYFRWLNNPSDGVTELLPPNADNKREPALRNFPTCELVEELKTREGVETTIVEPYYEGSVHVSGPAIVLNVTD